MRRSSITIGAALELGIEKDPDRKTELAVRAARSMGADSLEAKFLYEPDWRYMDSGPVREIGGRAAIGENGRHAAPRDRDSSRLVCLG